MTRNKITDALVARWRTIDPKLKAAVLSFVAVKVLGAVGLNLSDVLAAVGVETDPETTSTVTAGVIAGWLGYSTPNDGTILRTPEAITPADAGGLTDEALAELERVGHEPAGKGMGAGIALTPTLGADDRE